MLLSAVALVAFVGLGCASARQDAEVGRSIARALFEGGLVDTLPPPPMEMAVEFVRRAGLVAGDVVRDAVPSANGIAVIVVHHDRLAAMPAATRLGRVTAGELRAALGGWAIAIPPNLVLVDSKALALLILDGVNSALTYIQGQAMDDLRSTPFYRADDPAHNLLVLHALQRNLRFGNLLWIKSETPGFADSLDALAWSSMRSIPPQYWLVPAAEVLPLISHELGHLSSDSARTGEWSADSWSTDEDRPRDRREEDRADRAGERVLATYLSGPITAGADSGEVKDFRFVGILSFAELMRDAVLFDAFEGLRGCHARDFLVTLEDDPADFARVDSLPPWDMRRLRDAYENFPPIMTRGEAVELEMRLRKSSGDAAHRHMLERMESFLRAAARRDERYQDAPALLFPFDMILHGDRDWRLACLLSVATRGYPICLTPDSALGSLRADARDSERLRGPEGLVAEVGHLKGDRIWYEMVSRNDSLIFADVMSDLWVGEPRDWSEANMMTLLLFSVFSRNCAPRTVDREVYSGSLYLTARALGDYTVVDSIADRRFVFEPFVGSHRIRLSVSGLPPGVVGRSRLDPQLYYAVNEMTRAWLDSTGLADSLAATPRRR